jgi:hypothetical protein
VDAIFDTAPSPALFTDVRVLEMSGSSVRWIEADYSNEEELGARIKARMPDCKAWTSTPLPLRDNFISLTRALRAATPPPPPL